MMMATTISAVGEAFDAPMMKAMMQEMINTIPKVMRGFFLGWFVSCFIFTIFLPFTTPHEPHTHIPAQTASIVKHTGAIMRGGVSIKTSVP